MKVLIQRVISAKVIVDNHCISQIDKGLLLYVCLEIGDTYETLSQMAYKISKLRVFEDSFGKMNLNIEQVSGEILSISQFTLSWSGEKGHRPSFEKSMPPAQAKLYYSQFNTLLTDEYKLSMKKGIFGADMKIESINDGPVTFQLAL